MFIKTIAVVLFVAVAYATAYSCPDGSEIYEVGISEGGKAEVIAAHNEKRRMVAQGLVESKQPKATNMLRQKYDFDLGEAGRVVSLTCEMNHIIAKDPRWDWVGQNLYISWSSVNSPVQNWTAAVESWFSEHKNFIYPNGNNGGGVTGHYTQVVWAKSNFVGCDFVRFYDRKQPSFPYAKLYTCNYGPGGNWNNEAPYEIDGPCTGEIC